MAYIKKEPIVDFIAKGLNNPDKTKAYGYDAIEILTQIEYAPTADVEEVRHGEWVVTDSFDHHKTPIYQCSACRKEVADGYINLHKYCLHCGAKMDGGKNE